MIRSHQVRGVLLPAVVAVLLALSTACGQPAATPSLTGSPTQSRAPSGGPAAGSQPSGRSGTGEQITILGSGDILLHPPLWEQARVDAAGLGHTGMDFAPLLAGIKATVSGADVAVCHFETPIAAPGGPYLGYPGFSVPPQIAPALVATGFDTCSTASNHSIDQGSAGVAHTLSALDAAGLRHAGSYRSAAEHDTINLMTVRGVKVAQLAYSFGFNGLTRPPGKTWLVNQIDVQAILNEAHQARALGAQIVFVSLHFGTEYQHAPNSQQLSVVKALLASADIDLILGHHAHVVQPIELVNGKWVAYGMGNLVAHHAEPIDDNREGILAAFTFSPDPDRTGHWRAIRAAAIPVWMTFGPDRLVDIFATLARPGLAPALRKALTSALARIKGYLSSRGALSSGLTLPG